MSFSILFGLAYSIVWGYAPSLLESQPKGIVSSLLHRTQFSIRDINQGAHYGVFKGVGPIWLYGEMHSKGMAGAGIGYRQALGRQQDYWLGVYGYVPFQDLQSPLPGLTVIGIEGGTRAIQWNSNNAEACPSLQLSWYYCQFQLLGFGILPHFGIENDCGQIPFVKFTITLPKAWKLWSFNVKMGYSMHQSRCKLSIDLKKSFGRPSAQKQSWLDQQLNTMPYLSINRLVQNNSCACNQKKLVQATRSGNFKEVVLCLEQGGDVNRRVNRRTILSAFAVRGDLEAVKYLAGKGAELKDDLSSLLAAAQNNHLSIVRYLTNQGAALNKRKPYDLTPLFASAQRGHLKVVEYLLEQLGKIDIKDIHGQTTLFIAANGHLKLVEYLLNQGAEVNAKDRYGRTPLFVAVQNGHLAIVEYLLDQGAEVNTQHMYGHTPLFVAVQNGHLAIVEYLLNQGAEVNIEDKDGQTALSKVFSSRTWSPQKSKIGALLLKRGAALTALKEVGEHADFYSYGRGLRREYYDSLRELFNTQDHQRIEAILQACTSIDALTSFGISEDFFESMLQSLTKLENAFTPSDLLLAVEPNTLHRSRISTLHNAVLRGNLNFIKENLSPDIHPPINLDQIDKHGNAPLHLTALYGKYQIATLLLARDASVNIQDKTGKTPLHLAAELNEHEVLKLLLKHGAAVNAVDHSGKTALHLAAHSGRLEIVKCLLEHQADPTITDQLGNNVLHAAASCRANLGIMQLLIKKGINIKAINNTKETPVQIATRLRYHENITCLNQG